MSARMFSDPDFSLASQRTDKSPPTVLQSWGTAQKGSIVEVSYGSGSHSPQYAALHTDCAFLRVNWGPLSGWGTSLVLLPSLWVAGKYYQGAPIDIQFQSDGPDFLILFSGAIATLKAFGHIRLMPPQSNTFSGQVTVRVSGTADLDHRQGEAFKPLALSSMHVLADQWDAHSVAVGDDVFDMPAHGWLMPRPIFSRRFGLNGGTSAAKTRAPTLEIEMDEPRQITGWKTPSLNPDDDNVGLWAASDYVLPCWQYKFTTRL